jgi:pimeloyl-ACP methyl ester carboxylesterase
MIDAAAARSLEQRIVFLPGAAGDGAFWKPVGERLPPTWEKHYLNWPGLGNQAAVPHVGGMDDLCTLTAATLEQPAAVIAQSMGGIVAIRLALRYSEKVSHLVLVATSGGVDVAAHGGIDWRADFLAAYPQTARWVLAGQPTLTQLLPQLKTPTLLLWGDEDAISPVAVGEYLADLIPAARLEVIRGGGHALAFERPDEVAPRIVEHLRSPRMLAPTDADRDQTPSAYSRKETK